MKQVYIILILILAIVAGSLYHNVQVNAHERELIGWQNKVAQATDSMTTIAAGKDSALVQMAQRVDKIRTDNEAVKASLKENKASLRYVATMSASYKAELNYLKNNATVDTVIVSMDGDSMSVRAFDADLGLMFVSGNFDKYKPWDIRFTEASMDSIALEIGIAENKDGTWDSYLIDSPPGLTVSSMNALVSPYVAPWYTNIHLSGDVILGSPFGIGLGAGYGPWTGKIYGTSAGSAFGVEYKYYPFRK